MMRKDAVQKGRREARESQWAVLGRDVLVDGSKHDGGIQVIARLEN